MRLEMNHVHVWTASLQVSNDALNELQLMLNPEENERAKRYHFEIHRNRFIAGRGQLRRILSLYLNLAPEKIEFSYDEHDKPAIANPNPLELNFNLSHSNDIALYAFTLKHAIGIDIEKIRDTYHPHTAKRYYSQKENEELENFAESEALPAFYRIWAKKEAIIKAIGKGLSISLSSFSVSAKNIKESIFLENEQWTLIPLDASEGFQAALATNQLVEKIYFWKIFNHDYELDNIYSV